MPSKTPLLIGVEYIIAKHSVFKLALLGSRLNVPITVISQSITIDVACIEKTFYSMPAWNPALYDGKSVTTSFSMPITIN